jgi:hypothetical protein
MHGASKIIDTFETYQWQARCFLVFLVLFDLLVRGIPHHFLSVHPFCFIYKAAYFKEVFAQTFSKAWYYHWYHCASTSTDRAF